MLAEIRTEVALAEGHIAVFERGRSPVKLGGSEASRPVLVLKARTKAAMEHRPPVLDTGKPTIEQHPAMPATPAPPLLPPTPAQTHAAVVMQVKAWQRVSDAHATSWCHFVLGHGSDTFDPKRHDVCLLWKFLGLAHGGLIELGTSKWGADGGWGSGGTRTLVAPELKPRLRTLVANGVVHTGCLIPPLWPIYHPGDSQAGSCKRGAISTKLPRVGIKHPI